MAEVSRMKKVSSIVKVNIFPGKANPTPPLGPALGQRGVNIMEFCKQFNAQTADMDSSMIRPVEIFVCQDKSFYFNVKQPSVVYLIMRACNLTKGAQNPGKEVIASIKKSKLYELAKIKIGDTNAYDLDGVVNMFAGTALSMGIEVIDDGDNDSGSDGDNDDKLS